MSIFIGYVIFIIVFFTLSASLFLTFKSVKLI
nr:cytochrome b6-f complex subunit VI [Boldiaceae sp.]